MAVYTYVDYSALERKATDWTLTFTEQQLSDAALVGDSWMTRLITQFGVDTFTAPVLSMYATKKAACEIGTNLLGGNIREGDRPLYMGDCSECVNFEKSVVDNKANKVSGIVTKRINKGVNS